MFLEPQWGSVDWVCVHVLYVCCGSLEYQKGLGFKRNGQQQMLPVVCCRGKLPSEIQYGGKEHSITHCRKMPLRGMDLSDRPASSLIPCTRSAKCLWGLLAMFKKKKCILYCTGPMGLSAPGIFVSAANWCFQKHKVELLTKKAKRDTWSVDTVCSLAEGVRREDYMARLWQWLASGTFHFKEISLCTVWKKSREGGEQLDELLSHLANFASLNSLKAQLKTLQMKVSAQVNTSKWKWKGWGIMK